MAAFSLRKLCLDTLDDPKFKDYPNGWYYGELVQGQRHGQGMFFWPNGSVYMGGWNNDVRSGFGIQRDGIGEMKIGTWRNRYMTGWGVTFENISPTINFPLPEDASLREAMGSYADEYKEFIMDEDYHFGSVHEGIWRGTRPGGYGTRYYRYYDNGKVNGWTVGEHNKSGQLDGFGVRHDGIHPNFQDQESNDLELLVSMQAEYLDGEIVAGPAIQTLSYLYQGSAIQVLSINGHITANGYFAGLTNVSMDGETVWAGDVVVNDDIDQDNQLLWIISEEVLDMIEDQRNGIVDEILAGAESIDYDSSHLIPSFADTTPEATWVMGLMVSQYQTAVKFKAKQLAEQERLDEEDDWPAERTRTATAFPEEVEGMDIERDEDGNITGMGFSMTGNNPDQEAQNLNTLLNVFKNGGHFVPIDDITKK